MVRIHFGNHSRALAQNQFAIAGLVLPLLWRARKDQRFVRCVVPLCSAVVIALGTWWFAGRTVL